MAADRPAVIERLAERLAVIIEKYRAESGTVIGLLQDVHEEFGYLPEEAMRSISKQIDVPLSTLFSLATFYKSFRLDPIGKHHVCVCVGTACHVKGSAQIVETLERDLKVKAGDTSEDGQFTLDTVNCLGACALAPLVVADGDYHGKMSQKNVGKLLQTLDKEEE